MTHEKEVTNYETGEIETVNDNFVQLYNDKLSLIIEMTREYPVAVQVFTWLIMQMDKRNALVVSQVALAEALDLGRTTIHHAISYLKEKKAVAVFKSGNTNIYAINAQIAWKSDAYGKQYALFNASVYIADSEQDKPLFNTELIGHAIPRAKKRKTSAEVKDEAEKDAYRREMYKKIVTKRSEKSPEKSEGN